MITIKAPSEAFMAATYAWHEDEELNKQTGFGTGETAVKAAKLLLNSIFEGRPDSALIAIWDGKEPVGYAVLENIDVRNRSTKIHLTIKPESQNKGVGKQALALVSDYCFEQGLMRLTFSPFSFNKRAVAMAKAVGYKVEARTKMAAWTPNNGFIDLMQMRLVSPERSKLKRYTNGPNSS